ncbi:MAG: DUF1016 domain-containing protein [Proteobacteria bacterium]|nr:DUF1016 domain-containing protein [Pseudomonadota bacterium]
MTDMIGSKDYARFLKDIKSRIQSAQVKAVRTVNRELIGLYWEIGRMIVERQEQLGWGKSVVERLSVDIRKVFPDMKGFSTQNLWYMRQFYVEYREHANLQQLVGEIPWGHNVLIFSKIKESKQREYYLQTARDFGWTRNVLLNQIKVDAYSRQLAEGKQHNFPRTLPEHLAEQAEETLKQSYMLDFLGIRGPVLERELEHRMVEEIRDVIIEFGHGFAFMGNQYRILAKNNKEYFIDLLFYHRKLKCLVAVELKTGAFEPEHAGKMNFYLNLLDNTVKEAHENPSIGIILCAEHDQLEVEYSLKEMNKPVGVAEYRLTRALPPELKNQLPSSEIFRSAIEKNK